MEESGSVGLDELIVKEKDGFLAGVDAICISDNYWLAGKPCLTHGLRGIQYFKLQIQGPGADLHSGVFGGMVHEPMTDLIKILSQLVTPQGEILVPGIKEQVQPLTPEEAKRYEAMEFDIAGLEENVQAKIAISGQKEKVLMGRMRYPSLSLHGIEGAFSEAGTKTVIPAKVVGKFSLRLVPDMTPDKVVEAVTKYIDELWAKLGSKNKLTLEAEPGGKPWLADPNHWNYAAASKATEQVYGVTPDLTREGGSIPVALSFADTLEKNLVLLPMGRADDGAHSSTYLASLPILLCFSLMCGSTDLLLACLQPMRSSTLPTSWKAPRSLLPTSTTLLPWPSKRRMLFVVPFFVFFLCIRTILVR